MADDRKYSLSNYPLCWPDGWKRTSDSSRKNGQFSKRESQYTPPSVPGGQGHSWTNKKHLTVSDGVARILESLERMGINQNDVIVSTNVRTRLDGLPRSGEKKPQDPGAAVYWRKGFNAPMRCMAIDRYATVADNLAAIGATLEAMRAIERHGGAEILDRSFQGFAALPATAGNHRPWREVFGMTTINPTREMIDAMFKGLLKVRHPDVGGSHEAMAELNLAREEALREIGL